MSVDGFMMLRRGRWLELCERLVMLNADFSSWVYAFWMARLVFPQITSDIARSVFLQGFLNNMTTSCYAVRGLALYGSTELEHYLCE